MSVAVDFGTDIAGWDITPPIWGTASGLTNLGNALARRFSTPLGALAPDHPEYGLDLRIYVNHAFSPAGVEALRARIKAQAEQDKRVKHADVSLSLNVATSTMRVTLMCETALGPFTLVMGASSLTVEVLNANGAIPETTSSVTSTQVVLAVGPQGPAGPPGAGGGGGGGGGSAMPLFNDRGPFSDSSGNEVVAYELVFDFAAISNGTLTAALAGFFKTASGTSTFRMRVGGSYATADGTVVATLTTSSTSPAKLATSNTFTNPASVQPVKVTIQSAGSSVDATAEALTASVR